MANYSVCGIDCDTCRFQTEQNCNGCRSNQGKIFWGDCELYQCNAKKEQVASRHKSVRETIRRFFLIHSHTGVRQRVASQLTDERYIHHFKLHSRFTRYLPRQVHFLPVLLPIQETQRIYFLKLTLCPEQASCRILPTAEHDQCCFFVHP